MKKHVRFAANIVMTVVLFFGLGSLCLCISCSAQSTVATFESDYRPVYGESGDSDLLIRGVWRLEGYGAIVEISEKGLRWFSESSGGSWEDQVDEIPALFFRFDQTGKHCQITLHPLSVSFNATRLEKIPEACLEKRKWVPTELFEAFVGNMNDYYAFFKERKVDWKGRVEAGRKKIDDQMSESELFGVFKSMLTGIDDPHLRLTAVVDSEALRVRLGGAPTLENFRKLFDARDDKSQTMQQFSTEVQETFNNGIHQVNLRGESNRAVNRIVWGRVTDNIGYLFIEGMSGMGEGDIDSRLQMVHDAMDEILTDLADTDGIIIDLSFNGGGSDLYGRIIASHFADKRRLAMSIGPATQNDNMQDEFIEPYKGNANRKTGNGVRYTKPVFVVTSDITVSAAESFVLFMRCFPHVTTVGAPTRGALSDVLEITLPNGWDLGISNEIYRDHKGVCHEAVGIEPDIKLDVFEINGSTFTNTAAIAKIAKTMIGGPQETDSQSESDSGDTQTAEELLARSEKERSPIWIDGNRATIIYHGDVASASVWLGGQLLQMECAPNSNVWIATSEFSQVENGMLNYSFVVTKRDKPNGQPEKTETNYWRGPKAPKPVSLSHEFKGEFKQFELESKNLANGKRAISVYLPPGFEKLESPPAVVYMADGGSVKLYAAVAEPLILAGKIPPIVFVGVHNGGYLGKYKADLSDFDAAKDLRSAEYLPAFGSEHFAGHERFFCQDVVEWAEEKFGLSKSREHRLVLGHSNGARFAVTMGIRHPDLFGYVIGLSVAAGEPPVFEKTPTVTASFFLAAGTWEDRFHELTKTFHESIEKEGFRSFFSSRVAGHDEKMWQEEFASGIIRALGNEVAMEAAGRGNDREKTAWLKKHAVELRTVDPADIDFSDLDGLREMIGDARVVQLGEQTHGDGTCFLTKTRIIKFLHEEMGFEVIAFESGLYDCRKAWESLQTEEDAVKAMGRGVFGIWMRSEQIRPLAEYLHQQAKSDHPLELCGLDCQFTGSASREFLTADLKAFAREIEPAVVDAATWAVLETLSDQLATARREPPGKNQREEMLTALGTLASGLSKPEVARARNAREVEFWKQFAASAAAYVDYAWAPRPRSLAERINPRDEQMGKNLIWLANEHYRGRKIIVWAATMHIQRNPHKIDTGNRSLNYSDFRSMGHHAWKTLGDDLFTLGFIAYEGKSGMPGGFARKIAKAKPGSLEHLCMQAGLDNAIVSFRGLHSKHWLREPLSSRPLANSPMVARWPEILDGVLFNRVMSPSTKLVK